MKSIVFATSNPNKVREVNAMLGKTYTIKSLPDIGCHEEIPEPSPTLEGNALLKAQYVVKNYSLDCFSEDTGLEVDALDGAPGILTARYAGAHRSADDNMDLLLKNLEDKPDRGAQFRTVIALLVDGKEYLFEGICRGTISLEKSGNKGFGYDPVFIPEGYDKTFAELDASIKNKISHRGRAVNKLVDFLNQNS